MWLRPTVRPPSSSSSFYARPSLSLSLSLPCHTQSQKTHLRTYIPAPASLLLTLISAPKVGVLHPPGRRRHPPGWRRGAEVATKGPRYCLILILCPPPIRKAYQLLWMMRGRRCYCRRNPPPSLGHRYGNADTLSPPSPDVRIRIRPAPEPIMILNDDKENVLVFGDAAVVFLEASRGRGGRGGL